MIPGVTTRNPRVKRGLLGWRTAFESVIDNPYLADFYADMAAWSFHLQIFFLGHRAEQHCVLAESPESAIADRSIYEDAHIFARALHHMGNLSERDYAAYRRIFVLLERIRNRGRQMESGITPDYLLLLESFYDDWMDVFDLCPVLTVETADLDFVHKRKHLDIVTDRILDKLAGKEDVIFPENNNE